MMTAMKLIKSKQRRHRKRQRVISIHSIQNRSIFLSIKQQQTERRILQNIEKKISQKTITYTSTTTSHKQKIGGF
jgi:hypothetical protein